MMKSYTVLFYLLVLVALSIFIPQPVAAADCHVYTSNSQVPSGFGSPLDVLNDDSLFIRTDCTDTTVGIDVGTERDNQVIYQWGYAYDEGSWQEVNYHVEGESNTLDGAECTSSPTEGGCWIQGSANAITATSETQLAEGLFVVAYMCDWDGSDWRCGCSDGACTGDSSGMWNLQLAQSGSLTDGGGTDDGSGGAGGGDSAQQICNTSDRLTTSGGFLLDVNTWATSDVTECIEIYEDGTYGWGWNRGTTNVGLPNFPHVLHGYNPFGRETSSPIFPIQRGDINELTVTVDATTYPEGNSYGEWTLALEHWMTDIEPDGSYIPDRISHEVMLVVSSESGGFGASSFTDRFGNEIRHRFSREVNRAGGTWQFHQFWISADTIPSRIDYVSLYEYLEDKYSSDQPEKVPSPNDWAAVMQLGSEYWDNTAAEVIVEEFAVTVNGETVRSR